ncbi:MAG: DUF374 domain-containing protein [Blastocatellia bacterium]|nr:DUF374 domain-containing protein [Blastocatellia bacterium]
MSRQTKELAPERITKIKQQVYQATLLDGYPRKKRFIIRFAAFLAYLLVSLIGLTMRWQMLGGSDRHGDIPLTQPIIYVFWHNRILPATWYFRKMGIVVMTSQSYDGEIIARMIQLFGYGASRGSTTRGGSKSLREMASCLQAGFDVAFTIDGPKARFIRLNQVQYS